MNGARRSCLRYEKQKCLTERRAPSSWKGWVRAVEVESFLDENAFRFHIKVEAVHNKEYRYLPLSNKRILFFNRFIVLSLDNNKKKVI